MVPAFRAAKTEDVDSTQGIESADTSLLRLSALRKEDWNQEEVDCTNSLRKKEQESEARRGQGGDKH